MKEPRDAVRLFRIRENSTDVFFSADGQAVAAPSDVEDEVVVQKLVPNSKGKLPPEVRVAVPEGATLLGWHSDKAFQLFVPAAKDEPARVVGKSFAGRSEETLATLLRKEFDKGAVLDAALRFGVPAEAAGEMPIVDVKSGREAIFIARSRANRLLAQRFTTSGLVLAEVPPKAGFGTVRLVDPERARAQLALENAVALVPSPAMGVALSLVVAAEEKKLRAELMRLAAGGPAPMPLADWPLDSAEAKWLLTAALRPTWRPFSPDGAEVVLPDKEGCARMAIWRPRSRTVVRFFRGACYSPQGKWLAGPGSGISVEATFLCVEAIQTPPGIG